MFLSNFWKLKLATQGAIVLVAIKTLWLFIVASSALILGAVYGLSRTAGVRAAAITLVSVIELMIVGFLIFLISSLSKRRFWAWATAIAILTFQALLHGMIMLIGSLAPTTAVHAALSVSGTVLLVLGRQDFGRKISPPQ